MRYNNDITASRKRLSGFVALAAVFADTTFPAHLKLVSSIFDSDLRQQGSVVIHMGDLGYSPKMAVHSLEAIAGSSLSLRRFEP